MPGQLLGKLAGEASQALEGRPTPGSHQPDGRVVAGASNIVGFTCIRCGAAYPATIEIDSRGCPVCHETAPANLKPVYVRPADLGTSAANAPRSLWRYAYALPCAVADSVSLGEGQTPLIDATRLGDMLGVPNLAIKDEGRNPTWSHKDRFSTVAVSVARAQGATVVATASSGNAGASLAAYAARAGLHCVVTTFAGTAGAMLAQIRKYGATVLPLVNKRDRWTLLAEAASRHGWFVASPYRAPVVGSHALGIEGYKTIAYEIVEQSGGVAPDWCALPVCYGDALSGVWAGFQELFTQGAIPRLPRMVAAEVHGSLARALVAGSDRLEERSMAFESLAVSIGAPGSTYQALKALRESSGRAVPVDNVGLVAMQERLARSEGIFAELASVTPLLAIAGLRRESVIAPEDRVVAVITASGLKDLDRSVAQPTDNPIFQSADEAWEWLGRKDGRLMAEQAETVPGHQRESPSSVD
ncbi:threonine synthase [Mesorhizobium australicum]|uniref:Threonine synthase n=1 Tax=Mesorhizobium australicum TaxID=536018 RepID=A0A1X7NR50_9HYPH|nr:threonine synthase [Mesorhizobium australicum]SMH40536.1 threonine synthase [Mesorhizobium australicum]